MQVLRADTGCVRLGSVQYEDVEMEDLQTDSILPQDTELVEITLAVPVTCLSITNIVYTVDGLQHIYALSLL